VDRLPPAELLDLVLTESAYFVEMRGPRLLQARENLKKMRALIRRIQNRGYATLGRIAAHLDRLAVGDESNAVIDALDAVNLMTVHASKGLEFPIVFLVNLARGTGSFRDPIRVVARPGGDDVSVAVGDFRSDADEDHVAKESEETKRLLYVALTRARDRLYLGSVLKEGRLQPGRGSLAEVLPSALVDQFAAVEGDAEWRASSGAVHRMRLIRESGVGSRESNVVNSEPTNPESPLPTSGLRELEPLADRARPRMSVASAIADDHERERVDRITPASDRLVGTLVHRLLQRAGGDELATSDATRERAARLLRHDEIEESDDVDALIDGAVDAYAAIRAREDVRVLYAAGRTLHEVPFTMTIDGRILRGTVDCLVETAPGRFTILEFKTGRKRPEHQAQVDLYLYAMRQVFPDSLIDARLIYG
jgi:ATP-dependent helicase/nuclease subunit A